MEYGKAIELLGYKAKDKITGASGVITSVAFDLFGCIQVVIKPDKLDKDGKPQDGSWYDINRLKITNKKRVVDLLDFEIKYPTFSSVQGPEVKPIK